MHACEAEAGAGGEICCSPYWLEEGIPGIGKKEISSNTRPTQVYSEQPSLSELQILHAFSLPS